MKSYMLVQLCINEKVNNSVFSACKQMLPNLDPLPPSGFILDFIIYIYMVVQKVIKNISKCMQIHCLTELPQFRVVREGKERRRLWAQKLTPRPSRKGESVQDAVEDETQQKSVGNEGMLPDDIVKVIAAREKYDPPLLFWCACVCEFELKS